MPIETGAHQWDAGYRWTFPRRALRLLKLHGSVNWRHSRVEWPFWQLPRVGIEEMADPGAPSSNGLLDPYLIFGDGKLRPDGAWPALFAAFGDLLAEAALLVVVGYSFRDPHVNHAIERWIAAVPERRIINIDPGPNEDADWSTYAELRRALDPDFHHPAGSMSPIRRESDRRLLQIKVPAETGLVQAFGS